MGNTVPDRGILETFTKVEHKSVALGAKKTLAPSSFENSTVTFGGGTNAGGVVSTTFTLRTIEITLPSPLVDRYVSTYEPRAFELTVPVTDLTGVTKFVPAVVISVSP